MQSRLNPYLGFGGDAREAMEFYHRALGGNLEVSTYGEANIPGMDDPADAGKVMHSMLTVSDSVALMAGDSPDGQANRDGISIALSGDNDSELRGYFDRLSDGGTVIEPVQVAPWGDAFGMLKDRYGVTWMVNIAGAQQG